MSTGTETQVDSIDTARAKESTRDRLAAFDAAQRAKAKRAGQPILRMSQSAMPVRASADNDGLTCRFFFTRSGELMCQAVGSDVQKATGQIIADTVTSPGKIVVAANRTVAGKVVRLMKSAAAGASTPKETEQFGKALRILRFSQAAPVSSKFAVLTDVLERKFYAPTGVATRSLSAWGDLFDVALSTPSGPAAGMAALLVRGWADGGRPTLNRSDNPWQSILTSEMVVEDTSDRGGPGSMATQMAASEAINQGWDAICRTDPILRHRCEAGGDVVRIRPVAQDGAGYRCTVSGPVRMKEGNVIVTPADRETADVKFAYLKAFTVEDDELQLIFTAVRKRKSETAKRDGLSAMFHAMHDGEDLLVSAAPFLQPARRVVAKHWSGKAMKEENQVHRDVPLYVMLAGA